MSLCSLRALCTAFAFLFPLVARDVVAVLPSSLEAELSKSACALEGNSSLKYMYYSWVRSQHGDSGNPLSDDRYALIKAGESVQVQCYSACRNVFPVNVTWCVYVYHPTERVQLCLNGSGVVTETPTAAVLGLREKLSLRLCSDLKSPCLWVSNAPYYLNKAYFVCTTRNSTCTRKTFLDVSIRERGSWIRIAEFPDQSIQVSRGKTVVLNCSSEGNSQFNNLQWTRDNRTNYTAIYEDPFCIGVAGVNCSQDNASSSLKQDRVRMYSVVSTIPGCIALTTIISYLVIDGTVEGDSGVYTCRAYSNPLMTSPTTSLTLSLNLQVMAAEASPSASSVPLVFTSFELLFNSSKVMDNSTVAHGWRPGHLVYTYATVACVVLIVGVVLMGAVPLFQKKVCRPAKVAASDENPYSCEPVVTKVAKDLDEFMSHDSWRFPEHNLTIFHHKVLGKGAFGKVLLGRAEGIVPGAPLKDIVAVKTAKDGIFQSEYTDLYDELELMKKIRPHENIINLLGYCVAKGGPPCLIMEYATHGSLRTFLKSCRVAALSLNHQPLIIRNRNRARTESCSSGSSSQNLLSTSSPDCGHSFTFPGGGISVGGRGHSSPDWHGFQCTSQDSGYEGSGGLYLQEDRVAHCGGVSSFPLAHTLAPIGHDYVNCKGLVFMEDVQNFALQIASGLKHLSEMEVVHCDLAARNVLIGDGFVLKISDFGMARDISGKEYYRKSPKGHVPVKWTSPEALNENLYTLKNDIWSFGVVLWEIFTYGQTPYPDFEIHSVEPFVQHLMKGNRLQSPDGCPEFMYRIMQRCWEWDPDHRLSANQLVDTFIAICCNKIHGSELTSEDISTQDSIHEVIT